MKRPAIQPFIPATRNCQITETGAESYRLRDARRRRGRVVAKEVQIDTEQDAE